MKSTFIILCAAISSVSLASTKEDLQVLSSVCIDMVHYIFPESYCLHYISDAATAEILFLNSCLKQLNTSLVLVNPKKSTLRSQYLAKHISCNGYLIVSENYTALRNLFIYAGKSHYEFKTHHKILILYIGEGNFMVWPFTSVAHLKGNEIIVIDGLPKVDGDLKYYITSYDYGEVLPRNITSNTETTIRVSNIREDKELTKSIHAVKDLDKDIFKFLPWEPNFHKGNDTFKVACFSCAPYIYVNDANVAFDGIDYQIIKLMTHDWPVTFHVSNYSIYTDMYTLTIQSVRDGPYDLAACSIWLQHNSRAMVDTTVSYIETCATFLVPRPYIIRSMWFVFHPITYTTWSLIGITTFLVALIIRWGAKADENYRNFINTLFLSVRLLALNSLPKFPLNSNFTFKIIILIWCYACTLLTTSYSAGYSSVLTYPTYSEEIKTIKDMLKRDIHWGDTITAFRDDLLDSDNPRIIELANKFIIEKNIETKKRRLRTKQYAVYTERLSKRYVGGTENLDDYERENLQVLQDCFAANSVVYALKLNSPYKEILDQRLLRIIEHGFVQCWINRIINKYSMFYMSQFYMKFNEDPSEYVALDMTKLSGIFYFLLIGYFISIIVFIGELYYSRMNGTSNDLSRIHIFLRL
ncbi:Ligand-gated ion channel [Popillia japonica]|uniref:Ligand-gated ion channel n=1 Tax=Popillia japonica TaxID=7064 RepID=A0AAW1JZD3_POPJA